MYFVTNFSETALLWEALIAFCQSSFRCLLNFLIFNLGHTASTTSEDLFSDGEEQGYNKVA